jgi:hypothetical protein
VLSVRSNYPPGNCGRAQQFFLSQLPEGAPGISGFAIAEEQKFSAAIEQPPKKNVNRVKA